MTVDTPYEKKLVGLKSVLKLPGNIFQKSDIVSAYQRNDKHDKNLFSGPWGFNSLCPLYHISNVHRSVSRNFISDKYLLTSNMRNSLYINNIYMLIVCDGVDLLFPQKFMTSCI